jgi:hypothetical protein
MTALAAHALLRNATKGKRDQMQALPCKLSWVIIYNNYIRYRFNFLWLAEQMNLDIFMDVVKPDLND